MKLLLLTAARPSIDGSFPFPVPSLEVLAHEVSVGPLDAPLPLLVRGALANGRPDPARIDPSLLGAILIDGTTDLRGARAAAMSLATRARIPRIAILREETLAAVSPEWGIADFLTPDASPAEVDARLRLATSGVRFHEDAGGTGGSSIEESGVEIDESNFIAKVHGRTLDLTYKEFELLHFLALHPARVFTREQLLADVWGTDYFGGTRTVDVHVRRLRAKLGEHEWLISTVRGVGYGFARGRQEDEGAS